MEKELGGYKKNTKLRQSRHSDQKKYMTGTGGSPSSYLLLDDLPGSKKSGISGISGLLPLISGIKNILETEAVFNFESDDIFENTDDVNLDINHQSNTTDCILEENIPEFKSITRSYASEYSNTSTSVKSNNGHDYSLTENPKPQSPSMKFGVDAEKTKTSKVSFSCQKRTKIGRL
ncbi:uncharacterized protein LOC115875712 [Sitophilus oryzae]|uniref:Uncharacterized protein LOC115875712 n=1 Tax=Sitophilus oryzae TaxID=7048 RepID=A0A6J2X7C4_SITOR|nr:uncharacterized protein LOC115875712 [Sitophilus oryzae]